MHESSLLNQSELQMDETKVHKEQPNLNCSITGSGPPVVLVHGFAASHHDWAYLQPELTDEGYQVYAPDLIGHGDSPYKSTHVGITFDEIYGSFCDWIDSCQFEQEIRLVGHSLGGLISMNYAMKNPGSLRSLILINPYYTKKQLNPILRYFSGNPAPYQNFLRATPSWLIQFIVSLDIRGYLHYEDGTREQKARDVSRAAPEIVYIPGSIPQFSDHIAKIETPTAIIWGTKDPTLNPRTFPELHDRLPNATSEAIVGTGHQPHLTQPDKTNRIIIEFLALN
jgi:pimeloyl-ACP methyl ester carboxylesterase